MLFELLKYADKDERMRCITTDIIEFMKARRYIYVDEIHMKTNNTNHF